MENDHRFKHTHDSEHGGDMVELAVKVTPPSGKEQAETKPGFVWLGGFRSDMTGTKAQAMVETSAELGTGALRFDYSGHGASGGEFKEGTISRWVAESCATIDAFTSGPQILVGSSMGGWVALRIAQKWRQKGLSSRLAGLLLIAPAPDFTALLMEPSFTDEQRAELKANGFIAEPSAYSDEPTIITAKLLADGAKNCVLNTDLEVGAPVRILQGMQDPDVPHTHALSLVDALPHDDVTITLIKGGDHRLSRDEDIELLRRTLRSMFKDHGSS